MGEHLPQSRCPEIKCAASASCLLGRTGHCRFQTPSSLTRELAGEAAESETEVRLLPAPLEKP